MRKFAALFLLLLGTIPAVQAGDAWCEPPSQCTRELLRLEAAYVSGMCRAASDDEIVRCLRLRNAGLASMVARTYEATLAWFAEQPTALARLMSDQAGWEAASVPPGDDIERLAACSQRLLDRLRALTLTKWDEEPFRFN